MPDLDGRKFLSLGSVNPLATVKAGNSFAIVLILNEVLEFRRPTPLSVIMTRPVSPWAGAKLAKRTPTATTDKPTLMK